MAHQNQEKWSGLVDAKQRATLVTKENLIFNNRYEGDPVAGAVKIPVRDTEVEVKVYDKANGIDPKASTTTYATLSIDHDEAVNELIDGFDAASVPDGIVAERLDSAGFSLAQSIDTTSVEALEAAATVHATKTAATDTNAYKLVLEAKAYLGRKNVPQQGRWLLVSPEFHTLLLQDPRFVKQGDLSQQLVAQGVVGQVAGFNVFECTSLDFESTTRSPGKKSTTEFIAGHPNWCHRVEAWAVPVHLQDLNGSGKYIGASAVQGRKVYGVKVSKKETVYAKRVETTG